MNHTDTYMYMHLGDITSPPQKIIFKVLHIEYYVKNSAHVYRCIVCSKIIETRAEAYLPGKEY